MDSVQTPLLHSQPGQGGEGGPEGRRPSVPSPCWPALSPDGLRPPCLPVLSRVLLCWVRPLDPPRKEPLQRPRAFPAARPQHLPPGSGPPAADCSC